MFVVLESLGFTWNESTKEEERLTKLCKCKFELSLTFKTTYSLIKIYFSICWFIFVIWKLISSIKGMAERNLNFSWQLLLYCCIVLNDISMISHIVHSYRMIFRKKYTMFTYCYSLLADTVIIPTDMRTILSWMWTMISCLMAVTTYMLLRPLKHDKFHHVLQFTFI